jgi:hypothetical protein
MDAKLVNIIGLVLFVLSVGLSLLIYTTLGGLHSGSTGLPLVIVFGPFVIPLGWILLRSKRLE